MVKVIGLIIAAYTFTRMLQIPAEMCANYGYWKNTSPETRWVFISVTSGIALAIISLLTLLLLSITPD